MRERNRRYFVAQVCYPPVARLCIICEAASSFHATPIELVQHLVRFQDRFEFSDRLQANRSPLIFGAVVSSLSHRSRPRSKTLSFNEAAAIRQTSPPSSPEVNDSSAIRLQLDSLYRRCIQVS